MCAELCAKQYAGGGIYEWSKNALGPYFSIITIWLQWINTVVWFPTRLATLLGIGAYLIDKQFAYNKIYLVVASLIVYWVMTVINLKGIKQSSRFAAATTIIGMILPLVIIVSLGIVWLITHKPIAINFTQCAFVPKLNKISTWTALTAIISSFLGVELATVHIKRVKSSEIIFPKAILIAIMIIILATGIGAFIMALIVPKGSIF